LALSDIVNVAISLSSPPTLADGFGVPMILSAHSKNTDRIRFYTSTDGLVADGFATTDPEYIAAQKMLGQTPRVKRFAVGRRANKPTQHWTITPTAVNLTTYKVKIGAVTASYTSDASATVDEINQGLKAAIDALAVAGLTCALVGSAGTSTAITIAATTAGAWFNVFLPDASQYGILSLLQDQADPGVAADLDAIKAVDNTWYGVATIFQSKAEILAIAAWVEANTKLFPAASQDSDILTASTTDVASTAKTSAYFRTAVFFHPDNGQFEGAAALGRMFPLAPGSATWQFKTYAGVSAVVLTDTQAQNAKGKNASVYVTVAGVNMLDGAKVAGGEWLDVIQGRDWMTARLQQRIFGLLVTTLKVPYTDKGIQQIENECRAQVEEGKKANVVADSPDAVFTSPKVADISSTDKTARILNGELFSAPLAGAIHVVNITGTLTA
jgi:hypothetical protein